MELKSNTPEKAANEFASYLKKQYPKFIGNYLIVDGNKVVWEEGPFEWTMICAGCTLFGPSNGNYSEVGDFPNGISNNNVYAEADNHYSVSFYNH